MTRARRRDDQLARHALRNEVLRPSPYLGFAETSVGVHLMECGAYAIAEGLFRQAVWLNPYNPKFRIHLAASLYEQRRFREAIDLLTGVLQDSRADAAAQRLLQMCERRLETPEAS
jgi:cytochrome c-type biogenesis protein CcmH/NrfG